MRRLPLAEAKARLSAVIDEVERGEQVVITRRGRAVARIVAEPPAGRRRPATAWIASLREFVAAQPASETMGVIDMRSADRY